MSQPTPQPSGGGPLAVLTRRIGPAPVWLYLFLFVVAVVLFLRWRGKKNAPATSSSAADAFQSPALTNQSSYYVPPSDVFVNIQQPGDTGPAGPTGPSGPAGPQGVPGDPTASSAQTNPFINPDGTISVGQGANLYAVAQSVGLTGAQFAALNPILWKPASQGGNTLWSSTRDANGNLVPTAARGMPYKYR